MMKFRRNFTRDFSVFRSMELHLHGIYFRFYPTRAQEIETLNCQKKIHGTPSDNFRRRFLRYSVMQFRIPTEYFGRNNG